MALLLGLAAAALLVVGVVGWRLMRTTGLEDVEDQLRAARPVQERPGLNGFLDTLGARFTGTAMRAYGPRGLQSLDVRLRRAGRPDGMTVTTYVRRQAAFVVLAAVMLLVFVLVGQPLVGVLFALLLCAWMRLWLTGVGNQRQARIDAELPDFLDVLGVTVTAGLGFRQAVERVCEFHDGPLAQEMTTALREMSMGVTRRQAFLALRERTRSEPVGAFVTALLQAEELGVPLASALSDIAADVRRDHAQRVRQAAAKAAPKVSLVVTMTIVPGAIILIGAAVVLANAEALRGLF
jgi:tight adherence protein C